MSITEKAMVLNLNIGLWAGYRLDKEATRKVTEEANADTDAARVNKHLVPKTALKNITSAASAIRNHFYDKTLPWKDNGDRLLTRAMYTKFIEEHERLAGQFYDAVETFIDRDYPSAVDQASFRMGDLFSVHDYPSPSALKSKFYINLDIDAVTEAGDFRVQMGQDEVDGIKATMTKVMQDRIGKAMHDVWERLADVVAHLAERLGDQDNVFRESTLTNLEELVDMLPGLNVIDDQELERIRQDIKLTLTGHDAKTLRKDVAVRAEVAGEARRIMDTMSGFMNAFEKAA